MHAEKTVIFQTSRLLSDKEYKTMLEGLWHTQLLEPGYQNTYISPTFMSHQPHGHIIF